MGMLPLNNFASFESGFLNPVLVRKNYLIGKKYTCCKYILYDTRKNVTAKKIMFPFRNWRKTIMRDATKIVNVTAKKIRRRSAFTVRNT